MNRKYKIFILVFTASIAAFGPFLTDFYLPALPQLGLFFKTSPSMVQLTITVSLIGLAAGQLFIGPLSDKYGRKKPLLISLLLYIVSTAGCLFSTGIEFFLFFRLVQGLAGAGGIVISRSIATDLYSGKELARFFSMLSAVQSLAPICAPILGGIIISSTEWQGVFWILLAIGVLLMLSCLKFRESIEKRSEHTIVKVFESYIPVLKNKTFRRIVAIQAISMGVMFAYIASSPFIFQQLYGLSPIAFSLCFAINALGIMLGSLFALKFKANFIYIEISLLFSLFFLGMILPTSTTLAMEPVKKNSGIASAILGFTAFLAGGRSSPLAGLGNMMISTSAVMFICALIALVLTLFSWHSATDCCSDSLNS